VSEPLYKQVADDVERLYWDYTSGEIQDQLDIGGSTYTRARKHVGLPDKTVPNRINHHHPVPLNRLLYHLHYDAGISVNKMADILDCGRTAIYNAFEETDVTPRGQSEANRVAKAKLSKEELREMTRAGREAQEEIYGSERAIGNWVKKNPEKHAEIAKQNAHKGTPARESNGMAGVTGEDNPQWRRIEIECANCGESMRRKPSHVEKYEMLYCGAECCGEHRSERFSGQDHPRWSGGKHLIDSIKKQLCPSWSVVRDDERTNECYSCGASGCKLDVHHIIPISSGGTNESWNLMTLCAHCHARAESYTKNLPEVEAVFTE
jgi:hypothetical protein